MADRQTSGIQLGLHRRTYPLHTVAPYINWLYFFHAWGFAPRFASISQLHDCQACRAQWIGQFPADEQPKAQEAIRLWQEAQRMLRQLDARYRVHGQVRLVECHAAANSLVLYFPEGTQVLPLLRQQQGQPPYLCLSDFIRPQQYPRDVMGLFATTVDADMEHLYADEDYLRLLVQTLADRLAEAMAEKLHQEVRTSLWGYAPDEQLTMQQLCNEQFQGIRPAVGYPSLPDISINRLLYDWLHLEEIGIQLTDSAMMTPHASVSGLMLAHPQSRYFSIGKIGQDQLDSYARMRHLHPDQLKRFLIQNL